MRELGLNTAARFRGLVQQPPGHFIVLITGGLPDHHNSWLAAQLAAVSTQGIRDFELNIGAAADAYEAKWPSVLNYWSTSMGLRDGHVFLPERYGAFSPF